MSRISRPTCCRILNLLLHTHTGYYQSQEVFTSVITLIINCKKQKGDNKLKWTNSKLPSHQTNKLSQTNIHFLTLTPNIKSNSCLSFLHRNVQLNNERTRTDEISLLWGWNWENRTVNLLEIRRFQTNEQQTVPANQRDISEFTLSYTYTVTQN